MELTNFASLIGSVKPVGDTGHYRARITEDWLQGRAAFGGLVAGIAVEAMRLSIGRERPLRALLTSFVGPAAPGDCEVECQVLRSGKSVTWMEAKVIQAGQVCTTFSAAFGGSRESSISVPAAPRPESVPPEESREFPFIENMTPAFTQHFDMYWAIGNFPMTGSKESEMGAWVRFRDPADFAEAHIVALMDLLPPAVLQMQSEFKPISSLSWHLEMLDDLSADDALNGEGWWFFHVYARGAADGYSQQNATLYTPSGRALAMSQQAIAVFA